MKTRYFRWIKYTYADIIYKVSDLVTFYNPSTQEWHLTEITTDDFYRDINKYPELYVELSEEDAILEML